MPNPFEAFKNTFCECCDEKIEEGDNVWIYETTKMCDNCADENGWICHGIPSYSKCGNFKKPEYEMCCECNMTMKDLEEW